METRQLIFPLLLIAYFELVGVFVSASNATMVKSKGIDMNQLNYFHVPSDILRKYPDMTSLQLSTNKFKYIGKDDFPEEAVQELSYINLHNNYIHGLHEDAFSHMPNLLEVDLSNNLLTEIPILKAPKLRKIMFGNNKIHTVTAEAMRHYKALEHIDLRENMITELRQDTFAENKELIFVDISDNPLETIDERGLVGPDNLKFLHLENTPLSNFPSEGIESLEILNIKNTPNLFTIPDPSLFQSLKKVTVTHSMHCCAFKAERELKKLNGTRPCNSTTDETSEEPEPKQEEVGSIKSKRAENSTSLSDDDDFWEDEWEDMFKEVFESYPNATKYTKCSGKRPIVGGKVIGSFLPIECEPEPDAFNPCQDVMGTDVLRVFSWIISSFAIIGNMFQLVILFHSSQKSVYKLLMYNLGFSNLLMGIYLMVLCCVDSYTNGKYYNFTQSWQFKGGCQVFGFLAVFSTSLSVCSLVLITTERFLLIIFALQAGNQMHIRHARYCVAGAWLYSLIVAIMPATDAVSSYSKTAICLPMDVHTAVSKAYVAWLLLSYLVAFFMIMYCYIRMYRNIKDVRPVNSTQKIDTRVAKRMALIVFSNFLCWLPISIAGLVAMFSHHGLEVDVAKFLIVFIFPLNACTNPFLYAIFTKVFRDDTISLLNACGLFRNYNQNNINTNRDRTSSYFKSKPRKSAHQTAERTFLHIQPPAEACTYVNNRNIEAQTEFDSPETPIRVMIDPNERKCGRLQKLNDDHDPPYQRSQDYDDVKPRSDSTRGLLEEYKKRGDLPCSESTETSSTGMSLRSAIEVDDAAFSNMIGSVHNGEASLLCT